MPRQKLSTLLSALHEQLQGDTPIEQDDKQMLASVLHDIEGKLADQGSDDGGLADGGLGDGGLGDKVHDAIGRFEADHPTLSKTLHELMETLKQI